MTPRRRIRWTLRAVAAVWLLAPPAVADAQTANAYFEFLMARRLEGLGDEAGALAALERAASADPASAEIRSEIAAFHLRRNRRADAERTALEALKLDDGNLQAHRVLGLIYAAATDSINRRTSPAQYETTARNAIRHLERAATDAAAGPDIVFTLGALYLGVGESSRAVDAFSRVVAQNPDSLRARLSLSQAYAAAGDLENAISTLSIIVDDEPRVASTLAQYQEQAGKLAEAAENYTRALAVEPTNRALKVRRIAVLINAGEHTRAASLAAEAQKQHADDLRFPRLRARALVGGGEMQEAIGVMEPVARAFPRDAETQLALAELYKDAGRETDGERTLRTFLDGDPSNAPVLNHLGYLLAEGGRELEEAVRLVERALQIDPNNPYYLDSLGWAHFRRGDLNLAEKYLAPAAERLPRNSEVQDHMGDLLARRGRWRDAVDAWNRALAGDGDIDRPAVEQKIKDAQTRLER